MPRESNKNQAGNRKKGKVRDHSTPSIEEDRKKPKKKQRVTSPKPVKTYHQIRNIFNDAQLSHKSNEALECMLKLAKEEDCRNNSQFFGEFQRNLLIILASDGASPFTKWALDFVIQFILKQHQAELAEDDALDLQDESLTTLDLLFKNALIPALKDCNVNVRINSCTLLAKIIAGVEDIADSVYVLLKNSLVSGVASKSAAIRAATIKSLLRFQDVQCEEDVVVCALTFHLEFDPDHKVRQAALMVIEPSKKPDSDLNEKIIARCRDIKDTVRRSAYVKIAERIPISILSFDQRASILRDGLRDRNPSVRKVVEKQLIINWVKQCNEDLIALLTFFDIEPEPQSVEEMLKIIFRAYLSQKKDGRTKLHLLVQQFQYDFLDGRKLLIKQPLTVENAFLWRVLASFCKEQDVDPFYTESSQDVYKDDQEDEMEQYEKIIDDMLLKMQLNKAQQPEEAVSNGTTEEGQTQSTQDTEDASGPSPPKKNKSGEQVETDLVDIILPQLPHFCIFLRKYALAVDKAECDDVQLSDYGFIYDQLIQILLLLQVSDPYHQSILLNTIEEIVMLPNLSGKLTDVISPLVKVLSRNFFTSSLQLLNFVQSLTQKIHNSIFDGESDPATGSEANDQQTVELSQDQIREIDLAYAKICVDLEDLRDKVEQAVKDQDFLQAESLKNERLQMEREKDRLMVDKMRAHGMGPSEDAPIVSQRGDANIANHPIPHIKCLQLFTACMEYGTFSEINIAIQTHLDRFCFPGFLSDDPYIRQLSVKAVALGALIDSAFASKYFGLFVQAITLDEDSVRNIAFQSLIDIICQHGIKDPSGKPDDSEFSDQLSEMIVQTLRSENNAIKLSAVKGVAKLLFLGRISSSDLLSRLLILWYDENLDEEIKQFLGSWFPLFALSDSRVRNSLTGQLAFEEAFLPTLEKAFRTCLKSDESFEEDDFNLPQSKVENLLSFMVNLLNETAQAKVALAVCHKILDLFENPNGDLYGYEDKILCKSLQSLALKAATKSQLQDMQMLLKQIIEAAEHDPHKIGHNSLKKVKNVLVTVEQCLEELKDANCSEVIMASETMRQ